MTKTLVITGDHCQISDGYHTFNELYDHRIRLWIALCRQVASDPRYQYGREVWRSECHSDGSKIENWFVLGIGKGTGEQMTYHLPTGVWLDCEFAETLERAPEFDGHTSEDVLERLTSLCP